MKYTFGVDIGGTEVKLGKFDGVNLIKKYNIKTNSEDNGKYIIKQICDFISEKIGEDELVGIGMGVPGPVRDGFVFVAPNLGWKDYDVKKEILSYFPNIKVYIGNDANMAALGEKARGGAMEFDSYVFVTLGTGVGGGVVLNGNLVEGAFGGAGEIGHSNVEENGRLCTCGLRGCIERYSSATGIVETANIKRVGRNTRLNDEKVTSKLVFDLAKENDEVAVEVVEYSMNLLAITLSQISTVLNPEAFIIGGGVSNAGTYLLDILEKKFMEKAFNPQKNTKFRLATLGNDAGIYGCAYSVK